MESSVDRQYVRSRQQAGNKVGFLGFWKVTILCLGSIIVAGGLYTHLTSAWLDVGHAKSFGSNVEIRVFKICRLMHEQFVRSGVKCPDIALERFFVATVITCLSLSMISFVAADYFRVTKRKFGVWRYVNLGYHLLAAILHLIAATTYIMSAVQIRDIMEPDVLYKPKEHSILTVNSSFRYTEKLIVGSLTLLEAVLYFIVAVLIGKTPDANEKNSTGQQDLETLPNTTESESRN